MKFSKKQFEKVADQLRLLSWAQGAIITSTSGLHFSGSILTSIIIVGLFVFLQIVALFLDGRSEK